MEEENVKMSQDTEDTSAPLQMTEVTGAACPSGDAQLDKKQELIGKDSTEDEELAHMVVPGNDVPKWCSCRWAFCYISCVAMMFVYSVRVDISVAIVCMVKAKPPKFMNDSQENQLCSLTHSNSSSSSAEFEWSDGLKANILAGFFYGYTASNIPGGFLADRYGGRKVFGMCILLSSIMTLLHPVLSRVSGYLTLVLRILTGFVSGPFFPSMHSLWGRWAPPIERSKLMAICYAGPYMGNIITLTLSGYLCANGFDNGWGSIFYIIGIVGILFSLLWLYIVRETPNTHPRITQAEKDFLRDAITCKAKVTHIPWKSIFTSGAVWAIIVGHFCYNWSNYTLLTVLPLFMKQVLYFDIKTNGLMSSIPYLGQFLGYTVIGSIADFIQQKQWLSTRNTRVLLQLISFFGTAGFLVGTSFVKCTSAMSAVAFLFFAAAFMGLSGGGFFVNHVDIAPSYAGILFGITNCISALSGFLAPLVASVLTGNHTQSEWQRVFFVCAGLSAFGGIFFAIFAKGEVQTWAVQEKSNIQLERKRSIYIQRTSSCWILCCQKKKAEYKL